MVHKLFGTDGVRGIANQYPMTAEFALKLAKAAGALVCSDAKKVAIARDTRISGQMLESALAAGFMAAGVEVLKLGVIPTPALTTITPLLGVDMAVMITASHNPYHDNGIKLINKDGNKFSDEETGRIEQAVLEDDLPMDKDRIGTVRDVPDAISLYLDTVLKMVDLDSRPLSGLKVVLDCANGAFYKIMPEIFKSLGAGVIVLANQPDGTNINNECGSEHCENMLKVVKEAHAHIGIACDGDGDRIIIADDNGQKVPCEQIIAYLAQVMKENGALNGRAIVSTVVSNTGLDNFVKSLGVPYFATKVGERYVIEKMLAENGAVGGESSGHVVLGDYSKTGDALVVGLFLCQALVKSGKKLSEIFPIFEMAPCKGINLRFENNDKVKSIMTNAQVLGAADEANRLIEGQGRLVFRASGTEPVVKIWVCGADENKVSQAALILKDAVEDVA